MEMHEEEIEGFRLSLQQRRIWRIQQAQQGQPYRTRCLLQIDGPLNVQVFQRVMSDIVARHEILRTSFRYVPGITQPLQFISDDSNPFCVRTYDLSYLDEQEQEIEALWHTASLHPFMFDQGRLFHASLITLGQCRQLLLIALPALCSDSGTLRNLMQEISQSYVTCLHDQEYADETMQYVDFSEWQNELLQEEGAEARRAYWRKIDWSQSAADHLPLERTSATKYLSDATKTFAPQVCKVDLHASVADQIVSLSELADDSITPITFFLTCWQILLCRFTAEPALVIGLACDGRNYAELSTAMGLFTHVVPIKTRFEPGMSFIQTAKRVAASVAEANEYQDYFAWEDLPSKDYENNPTVMGISFEWENWPVCMAAGEVNFYLQKRYSCIEYFAIKLVVLQVGKALQVELHYDPQRLSSAQVRYLANCLNTLLQSVFAQAHLPVECLNMLASEEQQRLLQLAQGKITGDVPRQLLHQLFETQAKRNPDAQAVVCGTESLTYRQLNRNANQLAHVLRHHGVGPNVLVGLCLERSVAMIVGLLGILKAGGAYIPLDPDMPAARMAYQLQEIQSPLILTQKDILSRLPQESGPYFCLDECAEQLRAESDTNPPLLSGPGDLAYVIYTSGSTGMPKGVPVRQQSLANYTHAICDRLQIQAGLQFATVSTLAADLGNTVIFASLISGGCLHVLEYKTLISGEAMVSYMQQHPIDILKIVPSHLTSLLATAQTRELLPLRYLILGGEAFSRALLKQLRALGGECRIINHYGPTEATVGVLMHVLELDAEMGEDQLAAGTVPIGQPIANTKVYILDNYQQLVPAGVAGELYIGGAGLAIGYLEQPEQTATRFIPDPFSKQEGARLYRTGDLVRSIDQGTLEFVGRADRQVKLRGYRVEPGEIEAALSQHANVWESIVMLREDGAGEQRLVAYIVPVEQPGPTSTELRSFLEKLIPEYMVPSIFMLLEALPLTANGKVERRKLPLPDESSIEQSSYEEPRSPIEEILVGVWEEVLKVKHLGIRDNFFSMGGHSLLATQVVSRLRAILHIEVPLRSLFEASTIAELAPLVEQVLRGEHGKEIPPLLPASREGQLPLSFAQQRLWFLDQLEPGGTAYNIPVAIQLSGAVSIEALGNSLGEIMRRHEALRTTFHIQEGEPVQIIEPAMPFYLPLTELNGLSSEIQEIVARQLIYQEALRPFNLAQEPLLRATLLRMRKDEHILLLSMHHIASDGWSSGLLIHELISLYTAYIQGKPSPLAELPVQYADFACWQRQWLQGEVLETQLAYWTRQLTGIVPLQLPTDQPRMAMQRQRGTRLSFLLPPSLSDDLKALSQSQEVTLFITLLAAFQVLLARYTNQTDISVGTPIANRTQPETEGLIGFFVNTLVMRTNMADNPTFLELLERVREIALGAYAHPDLPFERLVEILQPRRDLSYSPLFQVLFILQHVARYPENLADVKLKLLEQVTETARYDLTLSIVDGEQGLDCVVEYNTDLFRESTIRRLMGHWQTLLNGIIAHPEQRLTALPLLTAAEHQHLLHTWNDTERDYVIEQCAHQIIEQQVKCVPDAIAVICGEEQISYQQLNRQANQLAHMLIEKGIGPEISVALLAERSITFVSSILAIFKAGGVYIPLDPLHPHDRLCQMLKQSACQVVVVDSTCLPTLTQALSGISTEKCPIVIHLAEIQQEQQERLVTTNPPTLIGTGNLAYVIYTSGSTGMPKGVMVEHGGMLNHIYAKIADTQLSGIDSVAQNGPQCFDISVWQSLAALLLGGRVEVMPDEVALKPERLLMAVEERAIAVLQLVPSMLRALITEIVSEEDHPELSALRWLVPTGDALPAESCREWLRLYPAIPLLNTYGSTECSDDQCHFPVTSMLPLEHWTPIMPIGLPIGNMHAYVLDTALMMVPVGVVGELYIGGLGVGRGYLNDPERTAKAFLPDPWSQQPGGRLYKASDMARRLADGPIEFLGRNDHLVKIRGYRIELSEIEGLLEQHVGIRESVVIAYEGEEGNKQLVSYIVPEQQKLTVSDLRNYLGGKLPVYMLPSRFIFLEALPLTPNGKLDRHGLPAPDLVEEEYGKGFTAPLDPLQEMIATIWAKILRVERVGIHEDFFALGGHSLLATQISAQVHKMMDVELPLRSLFESPTVAGLAERVRGLLDGGQSSRIPPILPVPREGNLPLSFAQQRLWFLDQLEPGSAFYNIPAAVHMKGTLNVEVLERSIQEVVRRHETLRTTFSIVKDYPVQVIGTSTKLDMLKCDLVALAPEQNKSEERRLRQEDARRPFNLACGPLLRILLLQVHEDEYVLQLTMHHIASDGWSIEVLVREISLLYTAFVNREPSPLAELPISYADFAYWQREWLRGEVLQVQLDYWKKQLAGATPLLLPTDHPRALKQSYHGASYSFMLPLELSHALGALSRQEGTTLFMTLLAAFQMLLYRYTNQDDIVVGTDIANRTRVETEVLIGFFVNLLVMRTDFSGNPLFRKVLSRVRQMVLSAYTHQDLPFELLVESLRLERNVNQVPLVQVLFVLQNMPQFEPQLPDITLSPLELEAASSKFDLAVFLSERAEGLYGLVNYSTDLFEASTIVTMMARFEVLLRNIIQQPDVPVDTIEMYTEAEKLLLTNEKQMWRNAKQKKLKISKREDIELPQDIVREESHR